MIFRFGDFELDDARFELHQAGSPVSVPRKAMELIILLLRHRNRLVSREELCAGPWGGAVVSDSAIAQVVKQARRALGDDAENSRLIRTIRGKGLRFIGDVVESPEIAAMGYGKPRAPCDDGFAYAVSAAVTRGYRNAHETAHAIFRIIHHFIGLRICVLTRIDFEANILTVLEAYDAAGLGVTTGLVLPADSMPCSCVVRGAAALREFDLDAHPAFRAMPVRAKLGLRAYIGVPLRRSDGTIWGTLAATDTRALETTERDVGALTMLAQLAVQEFENEDRVGIAAAR